MVCSACFLIQPRTTCWGELPPTVGWAPPHQSLIKTMPISWRHFLHWGFLFPDDSSLCHIEKNQAAQGPSALAPPPPPPQYSGFLTTGPVFPPARLFPPQLITYTLNPESPRENVIGSARYRAQPTHWLPFGQVASTKSISCVLWLRVTWYKHCFQTLGIWGQLIQLLPSAHARTEASHLCSWFFF